jgi:hypothetical protein
LYYKNFDHEKKYLYWNIKDFSGKLKILIYIIFINNITISYLILDIKIYYNKLKFVILRIIMLSYNIFNIVKLLNLNYYKILL